MKVKSTFNILGGFGYLLILVIISGMLIPYLFPHLNLNPFFGESWLNENTRGLMFFSLGFQGLMVLFFMSQCKYIVADQQGITFINPVLPFLRKKRKWVDYDNYYLNEESNISKSYEAIWLVKDNVLQDRISSFYYSNYDELKAGITLANNGPLQISLFRQFLCLFGLKIKK